MTESEWLECDRPDDMLAVVRDRISDRKYLLFACGCWRIAGPTFPGGGDQNADMIERILDEMKSTGGKTSIFEAIAGILSGNISGVIAQSLSLSGQGSWTLARNVSGICRTIEAHHLHGAAPEEDSGLHPRQAALVRELLGDPFRPVAFDPSWRTETVIGIATGIESDRAWDRMPILADALQDADCEEPRVLNHCRGPNNHIRGCWVLDLCLGHTPST